MLGGVPCTDGEMYGEGGGYSLCGILYRGNICIDPLVLDSFEQILARMHEG